MSVQEDARGTIWHADWDQAFYTYDEGRQEFVNLNDGAGIATVFLFEERPGAAPRIWVGGGVHGLWLMDGSTLQRVDFPPNPRNALAHNNTRVRALYRDPQTLQAVEYYFKMPKAMNERDVIVVDPMLATGNSAAAAIARLKQCQPRSIKFLCLLTCPEGIHTLHREHPDVPIYTAAIDRELNDHGYILPGLGDAGDRIFGTQ